MAALVDDDELLDAVVQGLEEEGCPPLRRRAFGVYSLGTTNRVRFCYDFASHSEDTHVGPLLS